MTNDLEKRVTEAIAPVRNKYYRGSKGDDANAADRAIAQAALAVIDEEVKKLMGTLEMFGAGKLLPVSKDGWVLLSKEQAHKLAQALSSLPERWR